MTGPDARPPLREPERRELGESIVAALRSEDPPDDPAEASA